MPFFLPHLYIFDEWLCDCIQRFLQLAFLCSLFCLECTRRAAMNLSLVVNQPFPTMKRPCHSSKRSTSNECQIIFWWLITTDKSFNLQTPEECAWKHILNKLKQMTFTMDSIKNYWIGVELHRAATFYAKWRDNKWKCRLNWNAFSSCTGVVLAKWFYSFIQHAAAISWNPIFNGGKNSGKMLTFKN